MNPHATCKTCIFNEGARCTCEESRYKGSIASFAIASPKPAAFETKPDGVYRSVGIGGRRALDLQSVGVLCALDLYRVCQIAVAFSARRKACA
jgi:hypothetical protein